MAHLGPYPEDMGQHRDSAETRGGLPGTLLFSLPSSFSRFPKVCAVTSSHFCSPVGGLFHLLTDKAAETEVPKTLSQSLVDTVPVLAGTW